MDTLSLTKEERIYNGKKITSLTSGAGKIERIYNGKKITSLTSGAGKTGQPLVKE